MQIKLFGRQLFEASGSRGGMIYNTALDGIAKSEYLPDFYKDTGSSFGRSNSISEYVIMESPVSGGAVAVPKSKLKKKDVRKPKPRVELTPKGIYQMKMLNDTSFKMKADPKYVDEQIQELKDKLGMIKSSEFDMNRGTNEIGSILKRLENRKKYFEFKDYYDEFPYTSSAKIAGLIKAHDYLRMGEVAQFLADMPKEATAVMKEYTAKTKELCDKKPIFYIVANEKDFQKTEKRRDPILLAQSPFGHFWQIMGAWDEEMLLIDEL